MSKSILNSLLLDKTFDILQTEKNFSKKIFSPMPTICIDSRENSYHSFTLVCRNDGAVAVMSQNILGNLYFNSFRNKISPTFNKVLKNMMNIRNHLLLQLDLACGNISEEYFDGEETKYLTETENIPLEKLKEEIEMLFSFTDLSLDSEEISEILNCSVDDAEKTLKNILTRFDYASS